MNILYALNYLILSAFLSLFMFEVGIAIVSLLNFNMYKSKLLHYLVPLWEIDGTFAVFYIVNLEATYPSALQLVGTIYIVPALVGGLFLVARNAFIAYSELVKHPKEEKRFVKIYAISTLVIAFITVMVLSSAVTGAGVNAPASTINLITLFANPFGLALFVLVALLSVSAVIISFGETKLRRFALSTIILVIGLALLAVYMGVPYMLANPLHDFYAITAVFALVVVSLITMIRWPSRIKYLMIPVLLIMINIFGILQYPYLFGGTAKYTSLMTSSASAGYLLLFTTAGGIILIISLILFLYLFNRK